MHQNHRIELRLLLTCFYLYLNCYTCLYMKQITFHYSLLSSPFTHPYTYIHIRAIVGGCVLLIYRFLLLYALWRKMPDLILIAIIFLAALLGVRLIFDFYGYLSGYIKQSLYYPFDSFNTKLMLEEIIDLIFTLIQESLGLIFSFYIFTDTINRNKSRRSTIEFNHLSSISE